MAEPNISLMGATYSGVKGVTLPKSGGGTATFPWVEGSATKTENGTYDVTNLAQLIVNVSGGGGSSPWHKLVNAQENTVSTTSTTAASAFTIELGSSAYTANQIIWVHIRDKAGKRSGYFFGSDAFFINSNATMLGGTTFSAPVVCYTKYTSSGYSSASGQYGVYGYSISSGGTLTVRRRYNSSNSTTINGTYVTNVYALDLPDNLKLFVE